MSPNKFASWRNLISNNNQPSTALFFLRHAARERKNCASGKLTPVDLNRYFFRVELYRYLIRGYCSYYTPVSSCSAKGSSRYPREGCTHRQICFLSPRSPRLKTILIGVAGIPATCTAFFVCHPEREHVMHRSVKNQKSSNAETKHF